MLLEHAALSGLIFEGIARFLSPPALPIIPGGSCFVLRLAMLLLNSVCYATIEVSSRCWLTPVGGGIRGAVISVMTATSTDPALAAVTRPALGIVAARGVVH